MKTAIDGHWGLFNFVALAGILFASGSVAAGEDLSRGHQILLQRGLQIEASAFPQETGYFDPARWAESNFTAINFVGYEYPAALMPAAPGMLWSNIRNLNPPYSDPYIPLAEYPYQSKLVSLQISDEQLISNPAVVSGLAAAFQTIHTLNPNVIAYANNQPQTVAELQNYMQQAQPDMLCIGNYPFYSGSNSPAGGSPTGLYYHLEKYRKLGIAGNDGTGNLPIPTALYTQNFVWYGHVVSESEIRLNYFSAWAFGTKFVKSYIYETGRSPAETPIMFSGPGTTNPTPQFYQVAETNRQSLNLGPALVRLLSTDVRMQMGRHKVQTPWWQPDEIVQNNLPEGISPWDSASDPYITHIAATNLGGANDGLEGDVIIAYFKPLDASFTNSGHADDVYFMIVNGLSDENGSAADCRQQIHFHFDFGDSGMNSLLRLNRDTGLVEEVALVSSGGSLYHLNLILDGGTGDLFKFNNGGTFVPEPCTIWLLGAGWLMGLRLRIRSCRRRFSCDDGNGYNP